MKSSLLKHPLIILSGVAIGVLIGLYNGSLSAALGMDSFAKFISFPGQLYLFFLQMTVIPIIVSAIASSLGKLMRNKSSASLIKRMVVIFVLCMTVCALTGMALGMFGKPGSALSEDTRSLLGKLLSSSKQNGSDNILEVMLGSSDMVETANPPGLGSFFANLIPPNIFEALSLGSIMAIVFFSIILGIAIGFLQEESALLLINLLSAIFHAFQKLINWSLYLLPFGLICLLAGQIADVGVQIFIAMSKFIILYGIGTIVIFAICTFIIVIRSGNRNPFKVIAALFEPILLAFATRNSMATLPSAITCLDKKLRFDSTAVNLTLPLGMTLGRFGNIFYFGLGIFFVAQIYNTPLEPMHYLIIFIGVIFAGTATAGASGIVTLSMLSIVLDPLSLPMEAVLIIFMAIDPIIDPFRTFLIVYVNMASTTLVAKRDVKNETAAGTSRQGLREHAGKQLLVYVEETQDRPPLLNRSSGMLGGFEIAFLKEAGRRLNRKVILKDSAALNPHERVWMKQRADIIAGVITKSSVHLAPDGFFYSQPWAAINVHGKKKLIYFLLPEESQDAGEINRIIQTLTMENFLTSLGETVKDGIPVGS